MRPSRVALTFHARDRAAQRGIGEQAIADLVLDEHQRRQRNPGPADWQLTGRGIGVAYDWPADGDATLAVVVTVWQE